jgi:hypothetical protein
MIKNEISDYDFKSTLTFIVAMGIILGLFSGLNIIPIFLIGYGAIYTGIVLQLLNMYLILKMHYKFFKSEMAFVDTLLVGIPIIFILNVISYLIIHFDFAGNLTHSYYRYGYLYYLISESSAQYIPSSIIFIAFFAPIYRVIKRKTTANTCHKIGREDR